MSVRLADRSFQYPVGIAENMLVEVGKFTFPADFVILEMEEDGKVPLILGRPFLHTADAVIRVKQKQLNLGVGTERMIFNINSAMKHSYLNDDTCFSIDEILEEDFDALLDEVLALADLYADLLEGYCMEGGILVHDGLFIDFDGGATSWLGSSLIANSVARNFLTLMRKSSLYKSKHLSKNLLRILNLKPLPDNLEYLFLEEPSFLPVIISSQLSKEKKNRLIFVLKKHKHAFTWKTTDISGICPSFCKHKIQLLDDKKPVI
ncbi:reverse transcriptase domain-containing protein [Tanacetum coccineum]|uniref:Reverse transcriptase domain-containing protein n=1 Tax=Tanacetum coccineum TaxID=301880 RepID=A0ABQ4XSM9_9ASTR